MRIRFLRQTVAERREMILHGQPFKTILFLSIPTLMMGIVQSLIPLIDGIFLNKTASIATAGAVGFASPIISVLVAFSQGLSIAIMSILGQLFGKGRIDKVKHCANQTVFYSFLFSICITPLTAIGAYFFSGTVDPEIAPALLNYLSIYSFVLPFLFITFIYNGIKSSMGQPEANFVLTSLLFILKIIFNFIFLYMLRLNEIGAVLGSLCCYGLISIWIFYDLYFRETEMKLDWRQIKPDKDYLRSLITVSIPSILSNIMVALGFILINYEIQAFGKVALNAQVISSNISSMSFTLPASVGSTITAMVSMNIGNDNPKTAKKAYAYGLLMSLVISACLIAIFIPLAPFMVRLFRDEPEIIGIATHALNIYIWSIIGYGIFIVSNGAMIGLGRTKMTLLTGLARIWLFRYLFILVYKQSMGVDSVFWGNLVSNSICGVLTVIILIFLPWKSVINLNLDKK